MGRPKNPGPVEVTEQVQTEPVSTEKFGEAYFQQMKESGLNPLMKGAWQKMYAHYLDRVFGVRGKTVVDLGCAMGAITSSIADYGAKCFGVDISEYAMNKCPFKNITFIHSDAAECASKIEENSVDFVHSMFMMNELTEEQCLKTFEQINKICKNDALVFIILRMGYQKRNEGTEILQPKYFWDEIAGKFGMKDGARAFYQKLMDTTVPGWEFMRKYQWPYLLYKVVK